MDAPVERSEPTQAIQDYLKAVFKLVHAGEPATTSAIAERLGVAPPSVTKMMKRLAEMDLVVHTPYRGVELTERGQRIALEIIRHHRLLELYLARMLGMPLDQVDAEAERLEHVLSDDLEARLDAALGSPRTDPHGDPIPRKDGTIERRTLPQLADASPGDAVVIERVSDADAASLRTLERLDLLPGADVEVLARDAAGGLTVRSSGRVHSIDAALARRVYVARTA